MDIDSYLNKLVKQLSIDKQQRDAINNSVEVLKGKIWAEYRERISSVEIFGSYDRGTELPQSIDDKSDVDILVTFKSNDFQPAILLKQLYQFADDNYNRSDVLTDHPTIVIEMTKVRFEVVPAYIENSFFKGDELKIPAPRNKELKWITTEPKKLKEKLVKKNSNENQLIVPLIKLIKYFNVKQGKPFNSFLIEHHVINVDYDGGTLKDYLFKFIENFKTDDANKEQIKFITELRSRRNNLITLQKASMNDYAILELQKFLPLIV